MGKDKEINNRAVDGRHVPMSPENSKANRLARGRWYNRMCDYCMQRGTILYKGRLYCADCAEREGIKNGRGKDC